MKLKLFIIVSILILSSCEVLKETGNIYEINNAIEIPQIDEEGNIYCNIGIEQEKLNVLNLKDVNFISLKAFIKVDSAVSRTMLGQYTSYAELKGDIITSKEGDFVESNIKMETDIYSNTLDGYFNFPCNIYKVTGHLNDKKIKIQQNYYDANDLHLPVLIINDEYKVYKCKCKEYILNDGSQYYNPSMDDIFDLYQKFQLFREIDEKKELLAEWESNSYTIFDNLTVSTVDIKKLVGSIILRIEWEKLFLQSDFREKCESKWSYYIY